MTEREVKPEEIEWRDVHGFEGLYEISSQGDLRSTRKGNILAKNLLADGYVKADLWKNGKRTQTTVHRIAAIAFHGYKDGMEVNHIDGDKRNNHFANLEWVSRSGNVIHAYYELGHIVIPVVSTEISTGKETHYPSIEAAKRAGFSQYCIHRCIRSIQEKTKGHYFRVDEAAPNGEKR